MVSSSSRRRFQSIHKKLERTKVRSDKTKYNKICSPCLMKFSGILIFWHIKLKAYYDKHWSLIILITCEDDTLPFTMFLRNSKGRKARKEYVCVCVSKKQYFSSTYIPHPKYSKKSQNHYHILPWNPENKFPKKKYILHFFIESID